MGRVGNGGGGASSERNKERATRKSVADAAKREYDRLVDRAKREAGPEGFYARGAELSKMKDKLKVLPHAEQDELNRLQATAQERQKEKFMNSCFIDRASIPGVGPARTAALRSFGIETAADVTRNRVMQVRGFGESLTCAVVDWRQSCERQFQFNPAIAVSQSDRDAVRSKFAAKRSALERALAAGPSELQQLRQRAASQLTALTPQIRAAAQKLAQARADLNLL